MAELRNRRGWYRWEPVERDFTQTNIVTFIDDDEDVKPKGDDIFWADEGTIPIYDSSQVWRIIDPHYHSMYAEQMIEGFNRTERGTNGMYSTLLWKGNRCYANVDLKMLNGKPQGGYNTGAVEYTFTDDQAHRLYRKLYGEPEPGKDKIGRQSSFLL